VVVVVGQQLAVTCVKYSNCLDICQSKLSVVLQPICLDGIAILLIFYFILLDLLLQLDQE
jgi:hypothetical protein